MTITVSWGNEDKTIIALSYERPWNWVEFETAVGEMTALLDSVNHPVDMIFDIRRAGAPPRGALDRFKKVAETNHPNAGWLVFIDSGTVVMRFLDLLMKLYGLTGNVPKFQFVHSMEEAHTLIAKRRGE